MSLSMWFIWVFREFMCCTTWLCTDFFQKNLKFFFTLRIYFFLHNEKKQKLFMGFFLFLSLDGLHLRQFW